ncbi:MAG: RNA polymerase sigma factor RpoD/SigA [Spirochaetales bacterium]|nr:MAG: RNA polymerase sigma factor RpoD/SigA [Spirochaetales bacterium]
MTTTKPVKKQKSALGDDENILSLYLKEINKIPLLTREEENRYAREAATGDSNAKNMLIKSNLRFVVNVAKKYQNQGLPLSDLISEGNIGIMNAIDRYDVDKGYHFISYAVWWIRQAILKAICEKSRMIRLPLNRANELVQIEKARKELLNQKGDEPDMKEIADIVMMDKDHVNDLLSISRELVSLDTPVYSEKDSSSLGEFIEDKGYKMPLDEIVERSLQDDINQVLTSLSKKEADIIEYRFGLNGKKSMSLKEIGDQYNLTKERIRQIEKKALKRLQHPSRSQYLEAYTA